jgi:hypothetical protein
MGHVGARAVPVSGKKNTLKVFAINVHLLNHVTILENVHLLNHVAIGNTFRVFFF